MSHVLPSQFLDCDLVMLYLFPLTSMTYPDSDDVEEEGNTVLEVGGPIEKPIGDGAADHLVPKKPCIVYTQVMRYDSEDRSIGMILNQSIW